MKAIKPLSYWVAALSIGGFTFPLCSNTSFADDSQTAVSQRPILSDAIRARYQISDEQMQKMRDQGMDGGEIIRSAQFAESSKKPLAEILKMRMERGLSWGMIAQDLKVDAGIGDQAVAGLLKSVNEGTPAHAPGSGRVPAVKGRTN